MVSFACSEVAQVSRASGAVFAFLVSDVLVLQRFQFQLGKSNDFLSTAVNRTLFTEGADAKKKADMHCQNGAADLQWQTGEFRAALAEAMATDLH